MSVFNKEYVHFMRNEELCGRYGYFADSIDTLVDRVTSDYHRYWGKLSSGISSNCSFPFVNEEDGQSYKFFYSDPKWNRGAPTHNRWVTNRELAHWLNKGNGECISVDGRGWKSQCRTTWPYNELNENMLVGGVYIRKWCDTEWHDPEASYMELD